MLKKIEIKGLFNRFNYEISLCENGITILTGPNGFGKSTMLKLIKAAMNGSIIYLRKIDFKELSLSFENQFNIQIKKTENKIDINDIPLKFIQIDNIYSHFKHYFSKRYSMRYRDDIIVGIDTNEYYSDYSSNIELMSMKDIIEYLNQHSIVRSDNSINKLEKFYINNHYSNNVKLVSEQRLLQVADKSSKQFIEIIQSIPDKIKIEIDLVLEKYYEVTSKLDSSYSARLFETDTGIEEDEFKQRNKEANAKLNHFKKYNLVEINKIQATKYDRNYSNALKIYFDDLSKKYAVFDDLLRKIDLFVSIVDELFSFKKVRISKNKGMEILDSDTRKVIDIDCLSSGEKQEIVMLYELIFNNNDELLLLLDEPELSLHIVWQKKFLENLKKIKELHKNLNILIATHSPQIINDEWDLQIDLGELYARK